MGLFPEAPEEGASQGPQPEGAGQRRAREVCRGWGQAAVRSVQGQWLTGVTEGRRRRAGRVQGPTGAQAAAHCGLGWVPEGGT